MGVLHEKVAIITGAANGIGRAIATHFAAEGARVVVSDLDTAHGEALVATLAAAGGQATYVRADVSVESDVHGLFARALERYGGVQIMINNAGIEGANVAIGEYDLAERIRINAICPGAVDTDMIHRITGNDPAVEESFARLQPIGHMGTPDEIAAVALFLCSEASSFLAGVALPADGGIMAG